MGTQAQGAPVAAQRPKDEVGSKTSLGTQAQTAAPRWKERQGTLRTPSLESQFDPRKEGPAFQLDCGYPSARVHYALSRITI